METYLLKSAIALCVFYTFFWLFLRNETYFGWNRIYLITSLLVSSLFPLIKISLFQGVQQSISNIAPLVISTIGNSNAMGNNESLSILSIIYISGAVFFSLKFLSKLSQIHYLSHRFQKVEYNGFRAVIIDGNQSPFTFFSTLFLSRSDYENGKLDEMIVHEKAHRDQFHSIDILLLELTTIIQWFNPFIWLFRIAIKLEHEFIADEKVLKEGFDKATYQKLLFEKSLGVSALEVTSNFNYSLLKNRLKMMTIRKSGSLAKAKYVFTLPLLLSVCFLLTANFTAIAQEKIYDTVEVMPVYPGGDNGVRAFIAQNMKYPELAAERGVQARIFLTFVVTDKGDVKDVKVIKTSLQEKNKEGEITEKDYATTGDEKFDQAVKALENESVRVVSLLGKFTPGKQNNKNVNVQYTFPITFVLQ